MVIGQPERRKDDSSISTAGTEITWNSAGDWHRQKRPERMQQFLKALV
jgi:hypothetical protein